MVFGLKYGRPRGEPGVCPASGKAVELSKEFMNRFKSRCDGALLCKDLRGFDVSTPEGRKERDRRRESGTMPDCSKFIKDAAEILEEIL